MRNKITLLVGLLVLAFMANAQTQSFSLTSQDGKILTPKKNIVSSKAVIFTEDFSDGAFPAGWQTVDNSGSGFVWSYYLTNPYSVNTTTVGNGYAIADSYAFGGSALGDDADLISPAIDCSAYSFVLLSFDHWFYHGSGGEGHIMVSGDDGVTWDTIANYRDVSSSNAATEDFSITDIAAGKSQVRIKFNWKGDNSWIWAIDDIKLSEPADDFAINEVILPYLNFENTTTTIKAVVENKASTAQSKTISAKVNGTELGTATTATLAYGDIDTLSFNWTPTTAGGYRISADVPADEYNGNNTDSSDVVVLTDVQLAEDFESDFLPTGWKQTSNVRSWAQTGAFNIHGNSTIIITQDENSPEELLISRPLILDGTITTLSYWTRGSYNDFGATNGFGSSTLQIKYRAVGTAVWTDLGVPDDYGVSGDATRLVEVDLSIIPNGNYEFAFATTSTMAEIAGVKTGIILDDIYGPEVMELIPVTFTVKDESLNLLEGVNITMDGQIATTDASGVATISVLDGTYNYTASLISYSDATNSVTVSGTPVPVDVTMQLMPRTVTFNITDGTDAIVGAEVSLNGYGIQTTDATGNAVFTDVLPENGISYTVTASGFSDVTGTVDVIDQDVNENIIMNIATYPVTFTVTDGTAALSGAQVALSGYGSKTTNASGQAVFASVGPENGISYTVTASGYDNVTSTINVVNQDVSEAVVMDLTTYTVTFNVTDGTAAIVGADVSLTGYGSQTTDASGQAVFADIIPENGISYTVTSSGYDDATGTIDVVNQNGSKAVVMDLTTYAVTFNVTDGTAALAGANVSLTGYGSQSTDALGQAVFASVLPENGISYSVTASGYDDVTNTINVINQDVSEAVAMNLITYTVTFNVTDGAAPLAGANVSLTGYGSQTTDASGQAAFVNVVPENGISYIVTAIGYDDVNGTIDVVNQDGSKAVAMTLAKYNVTFNVTDGAAALVGADVSLTGYGSQTTDASGQTVFVDVVPENGISYTVTLSGYDDVTSTIDVVDQDVSEAVALDLTTYTVTFNVTDGTAALAGANVSLTGYGLQTTDALGQAVFTGVVPENGISYTATNSGYDDVTSTINVVDRDVSEAVALTLTAYTVTFNVTDGTAALAGADVSFTGYGSQTTDASGQAVFAGVVPENGISYTVTNGGYDDVTSTIDVVDQDVIEAVAMTLTTYTVTFNVTDGTAAIVGADVSLTGYGSQNTDASGQAVFAGVVPESGVSYTVNATGYNEYDSIVTVTNDDVIIDLIMNLVGLNNQSSIEFSFYPNPGSGQFNLQINGAAQVKIMDISGSLVFNNIIIENGIIDLSSQKSGLYILQIRQNNHITTQRIILK